MASTIGFDLDMTLIDSRPGIHACYVALAERTGTYIDADLAVTRLGPPLVDELTHWFPPEEIPAAADLYRALYPETAIAATPAMPDAAAALAAVRATGARTLVVTAKYAPNARRHLTHLGIEPDILVGDLWAERKADALREHGASIYVGDHVGDVRGARAAGALSVAVATGPCDAAELRAAGADVVLEGLHAFPAWLTAHLAENGPYPAGRPYRDEPGTAASRA
ncbi:haloacid dehalogenase-like hydrolase [Streptomyces sp. J2-1]|uniref:HAD family hydrolase n=1 Tax=Streptomyces corallincola TaxID=2851888 RepID=UPI001C381365|nr:haloacid dehalogenase-like hydrolase [Streptomyces corallincola]MBV2354674.1 haloacid dehalogenase-like hydrolase [Streptomyces corallincola]